MKFTIPIACLLAGVALAGGVTDAACQGSTMSPESAEYPSVDASFLSALEWRFVGPFRGGRVPAVAGDADNPHVFYFGAAHGGVWKTTDA
ncbi:MAG: hypothetical protein IID38_03285, partial [Planctomycetes bacterium]|nr:hypothetical protein [Planctomycetota bacterium]